MGTHSSPFDTRAEKRNHKLAVLHFPVLDRKLLRHHRLHPDEVAGQLLTVHLQEDLRLPVDVRPQEGEPDGGGPALRLRGELHKPDRGLLVRISPTTSGNQRSHVCAFRYLRRTYLLISPTDKHRHMPAHMRLPSLGSYKSGREAEGMLKAVEWESQLQ